MNSRVREPAVLGRGRPLHDPAIQPVQASDHAPEDEVIFSDFMAKLDKGEVDEGDDQGQSCERDPQGSKPDPHDTAEYPELVKVLREKDVQIEAKPPDESPWYITFLVTWGPFVLFLGLWFFLMRQMQIGGNKALSFGKSRARHATEERKEGDVLRCRRYR